jgi:hypothetical protein
MTSPSPACEAVTRAPHSTLDGQAFAHFGRAHRDGPASRIYRTRKPQASPAIGPGGGGVARGSGAAAVAHSTSALVVTRTPVGRFGGMVAR